MVGRDCRLPSWRQGGDEHALGRSRGRSGGAGANAWHEGTFEQGVQELPARLTR